MHLGAYLKRRPVWPVLGAAAGALVCGAVGLAWMGDDRTRSLPDPIVLKQRPSSSDVPDVARPASDVEVVPAPLLFATTAEDEGAPEDDTLAPDTPVGQTDTAEPVGTYDDDQAAATRADTAEPRGDDDDLADGEAADMPGDEAAEMDAETEADANHLEWPGDSGATRPATLADQGRALVDDDDDGPDSDDDDDHDADNDDD